MPEEIKGYDLWKLDNKDDERERELERRESQNHDREIDEYRNGDRER